MPPYQTGVQNMQNECESSEGIKNHIGEMHKGYNDPLFLRGLKYCLSKVHFYYVIFNTSYVYNHVYLKIKTSISYAFQFILFCLDLQVHKLVTNIPSATVHFKVQNL